MVMRMTPTETRHEHLGQWGRLKLSVAVSVVALGGLAITGAAIGAELNGVTEKPSVDQTLVSYTPTNGLSGRITIAGSDTMQPLMIQLAAEFSRLYPDVKFAVEGGGSSAGIREFVIGYSDQRRGDKARKGHEGADQVTILASSRKLSEAELKAFRARYGYDPLEFPIAADAVAVYVHKDSTLSGLTLDQVDAIFSKTRKRGGAQDIATWGQLGLNNGWGHAPIHLYGRDQRSGTQAFFQEVVLQGGEFKESVKEEPGSASVILAISRDPYGIGYSGIGYESSSVRAVPLASHAGGLFVSPTPDTVATGAYPLSRYLYLYVNQDPESKFDPELREFLRFVNSRDGQETVAKAKSVPLPPGMIAKNLTLLNGETITASVPSHSN